MKILIRGDFTKFYFNFFPQIVVNIRWGKKEGGGGDNPLPSPLCYLHDSDRNCLIIIWMMFKGIRRAPIFVFYITGKVFSILELLLFEWEKKPFKRFNFTVNFLFSVMISPSLIITFITNIYDFWNSIWRNGRKELASEIFLRYLKS